MASRQPLIAGNWKMNGLRADGTALAKAVAEGAGGPACGFVVCPPATLLAPVAAALAGSRVGLGGQDCHAKAKGAHTGDISAAMLADIGCSHVIVGHSERRTDHGEDDAAVNAKALAAHAAGLTAIVCVGESEADRDSGPHARRGGPPGQGVAAGRRDRGEHRPRLRAGLGDRQRPHADSGANSGGPRPHPRDGRGRSRTRSGGCHAAALRRVGQARQCCGNTGAERRRRGPGRRRQPRGGGFSRHRKKLSLAIPALNH